jgi:large subunit ribosomal protein L15
VKLHDLRPAAGSRRERTRVGRGIAAGKGKTAGRGTKGQKARAGASIPAWFEGGQTPIHIRVPKLRGFKNRLKIVYAPVNVGTISEYAAAGRFGVEGSKKGDPITVNAETLASAGLIGSAEKPVKVLGHGDVSEKLFVAADKFSASARSKIEAAGGFVQVLAPEKVQKSDDEKAAKPAKGKAATKPAEVDEADVVDAIADSQPDVDVSSAPESEGSATPDDIDPMVRAEEQAESAEEVESAETSESGEAEAKPKRRSSKSSSEADA